MKFISPGWSGAPDRLCLWPGGRASFVEVKATGEKTRPLQVRRHEMLRMMGFPVDVVDRKEQIPGLIAKFGGGEVDKP